MQLALLMLTALSALIDGSCRRRPTARSRTVLAQRTSASRLMSRRAKALCGAHHGSKAMDMFERSKLPSEEPIGIVISRGAALESPPRLLAYVWGEAPTREAEPVRDKAL